ncbi:MAG: hypothetical protein LH467_07480 [Gemmatimonadaceae bacterium]|nr:hypothetical protein [Gemmatimonadaceae bacterium]
MKKQVFVVAGFLAVSCRNVDSPILLTGPQIGEARAYMYCIEPTPECPAPPADPSDTHVSADITYSTTYTASLSEYFIDPVTGQYTNTLTVTPSDAHVHVEAGYAPSGQPRITTSYTDGADGATAAMPQIVSQDLAGDYLTDINPYGYSLVTSTPDSMQAAPAMDLVGSTANGDITAGVLVSIADTLASSSSVGTMDTPGLSPDQARSSRFGIPSEVPAAVAFARASSSGEIVAARLHGIPVRIRLAGRTVLVVEDVPGDASAGIMRSSSTASATSSRDKRTRKFVKRSEGWVLEEDRSEVDFDDEQGHRHAETVTTYRNVKIFQNPQRDAHRRAMRPTTDWIPRSHNSEVRLEEQAARAIGFSSGAGLSRGAMAVPGQARRFVVCDDGCAGGGSPPPTPASTGDDPPCIGDVRAVVNSSTASVNILYQHGFLSSATTWCQMSRYVRERYRVGSEIRHTLNWRASYEDQSADLQNRIRNDVVTNPGPYVLVGHSNGGIINRYTAQDLRDASLVRGVVTVSTPHGGVYLANISERVLVGALSVPITGYLLGCDLANAYVCTRGRALAGQAAIALAPILASSAAPVIQEMGTTVPFHSTINGRGDAGYRYAGVRNRVWDRWSLWRLLADSQGCPQGFFDCDNFSRLFVTDIDKKYHHYIKCAVVSGLLGIVWSGARATARGCATNAAILRVTDAAYKRLSVASGHGDAVVPEFSQMYPGAPPNLQFLVDDSDSHLGETRSRRTARGVLNALNIGIGIPFDQ